MDPTEFVNSSKKGSCRLVERNAPKIRSRCFETHDESWIYAYKPECKLQSTVCVFQEEPNLTKVARAQRSSKQIMACFFGKTVNVTFVLLKQLKTVNSEWYTTAVDAFRMHVLEIPRLEWQTFFDNWFKRMQSDV